MKHLDQLRAKLKAQHEARTKLLAKIEGVEKAEDITVDDTTALKKLNDDCASLESQIDAIEVGMRAKAEETRSAGDPADVDDDGAGRSVIVAPKRWEDITRQNSPAAPAEILPLSVRMGLLGMSIAARGFQHKDGVEVQPVLKILEERGWARFAQQVDKAMKARALVLRTLEASTNTAGGFLTPDARSTDIVELLYPETTFLQGGPRRVPMPNGTYSQPKAATGVTATYRREGARITNDEPTFAEMNMSAKFAGVIVPATRQMLEWTVGGAREFIEGDMREAMGQLLDAKAYFGDGTSGEPLGIVNYPGVQTVAIQGTTTATLAQIDAVAAAASLALIGSNISSRNRWRWVMAPRTLMMLQNKRVGASTDGEFAYPETRGATPMWAGIPVLISTQIPVNLDTSGGGFLDESYILLINFADVLFGVTEDLVMSASAEASITINGSMVSAFENDLVFIRAMSAHDVGLRRPISVVVISSVRWTP